MSLLFVSLGLLVGWVSGDATKVPFHVAGWDDKHQELIIDPYVAPHMGFAVIVGERPESGVVRCSQSSEQRTHDTFTYNVVVLECDGGLRLEMRDIDLEH